MQAIKSSSPSTSSASAKKKTKKLFLDLYQTHKKMRHPTGPSAKTAQKLVVLLEDVYKMLMDTTVSTFLET